MISLLGLGTGQSLRLLWRDFFRVRGPVRLRSRVLGRLQMNFHFRSEVFLIIPGSRAINSIGFAFSSTDGTGILSSGFSLSLVRASTRERT